MEVMRYLNTLTLKQEIESNVNNIIDTDDRVKNWFQPAPDGFIGEWLNGVYTFIKIPVLSQADITANAQALNITAINKEARNYLELTDWYVIREAEGGTAAPSDITNARAAARLLVV